jgi:Na+-driven multidrug efflux pump
MLTTLKERYLAPKAFYQKVGGIALPLAAQQLLNQGAGFVDTIMVSHVGGAGAVAVATQLDNLLGTVSFGINAGINIYSAQFYGARDWKSLKKCFGFQLLMNFLNFLIFFSVAQLFGNSVLSFYSSGDSTLIQLGWKYLSISSCGYLFNCVINAYSFMYRAIHKTKVPMYIGLGINLLNALLNFLLIFGHLGLPRMGVAGAALATVIANGVGAVLHIVYAFVTRQPFLGSIREMTGWDRMFLFPIIRRMIPLIINEALFGLGNSMYVKAYGLLGGALLLRGLEGDDAAAGQKGQRQHKGGKTDIFHRSNSLYLNTYLIKDYQKIAGKSIPTAWERAAQGEVAWVKSCFP